jgi:hypothetical protein
VDDGQMTDAKRWQQLMGVSLHRCFSMESYVRFGPMGLGPHQASRLTYFSLKPLKWTNITSFFLIWLKRSTKIFISLNLNIKITGMQDYNQGRQKGKCASSGSFNYLLNLSRVTSEGSRNNVSINRN